MHQQQRHTSLTTYLQRLCIHSQREWPFCYERWGFFILHGSNSLTSSHLPVWQTQVLICPTHLLPADYFLMGWLDPRHFTCSGLTLSKDWAAQWHVYLTAVVCVTLWNVQQAASKTLDKLWNIPLHNILDSTQGLNPQVLPSCSSPTSGGAYLGVPLFPAGPALSSLSLLGYTPEQEYHEKYIRTPDSNHLKRFQVKACLQSLSRETLRPN